MSEYKPYETRPAKITPLAAPSTLVKPDPSKDTDTRFVSQTNEATNEAATTLGKSLQKITVKAEKDKTKEKKPELSPLVEAAQTAVTNAKKSSLQRVKLAAEAVASEAPAPAKPPAAVAAPAPSAAPAMATYPSDGGAPVSNPSAGAKPISATKTVTAPDPAKVNATDGSALWSTVTDNNPANPAGKFFARDAASKERFDKLHRDGKLTGLTTKGIQKLLFQGVRDENNSQANQDARWVAANPLTAMLGHAAHKTVEPFNKIIGTVTGIDSLKADANKFTSFGRIWSENHNNPEALLQEAERDMARSQTDLLFQPAEDDGVVASIAKHVGNTFQRNSHSMHANMNREQAFAVLAERAKAEGNMELANAYRMRSIGATVKGVGDGLAAMPVSPSVWAPMFFADSAGGALESYGDMRQGELKPDGHYHADMKDVVGNAGVAAVNVLLPGVSSVAGKAVGGTLKAVNPVAKAVNKVVSNPVGRAAAKVVANPVTEGVGQVAATHAVGGSDLDARAEARGRLNEHADLVASGQGNVVDKEITDTLQQDLKTIGAENTDLGKKTLAALDAAAEERTRGETNGAGWQALMLLLPMLMKMFGLGGDFIKNPVDTAQRTYGKMDVYKP